MTIQSDSDKRKFIRFEIFEYALADLPEFYEPVQVVVVNIGLGGLQVRSRRSLTVGSPCKLGIATVDYPKLILPVEIRHCVEIPGSDLYGVGMKFRPTNHEERLAIATYVHDVFQRQCDLLAT